MRRKTGKRAIAAALFVVALLGQAQAKPVKLTLWSGYPDLQGFYESVAKDFTAQNPEITVEVQTFALADLDKKLGMSVPSGTSADILELISLYSYPWAQKYFAEVPADLQKSSLAVINKTYLHDVMYGDKMMGLPFCFYSEVLYYNKDMLAEAGIKGPPETIDQLIDYATRLTKRDAQGNVTRSGISMRFAGNPSGTAEKFWAFGLMPFGGDVLEESAKKPGKYHNGLSTDAGYKAMNLYLDLLYKYKVTDFNIKQDSDAFAQGKAAMFEREQYVVGTLKTAAPDLKYGASYLPKGTARGTFAITRNMFVPKSCKEQEAAWKFVTFFYSKPVMDRMVRETGWLSTRADLDYKSLLKESPQLLAAIDNPSDLQFIWQKRLTIENGIMTKVGEEITKLFRDQSLVGNEAKIRAAMRDLGTVVDEMLKDSGLYAE
jgi:ABC-type sugar transport system, periplasmic component